MSRKRGKNPHSSKDSKGKEPVKAGVDEKDSIESQADTKSGRNDPAWYARDPSLLMDAANYPFAYPVGAPITLGHRSSGWGQEGSTERTPIAQAKITVPGLLTLYTVPSLGYSYNMNDPANAAAQALYSHVRYVNSGRKNYDPADLMMYCLAMADIYSFVTWCKRLYGYAFMYSQQNKFIGKALIAANGIRPESLINNLANFRYWLNAYIAKVSAFAIPADIALFNRKVYLYANLYIENGFGNIKDQLYQYAPKSFYKYVLEQDPNSEGTLVRGTLTHVDFRMNGDEESNLEISRIFDFGNSLLENVNGNEDFGIMSGDILKAFQGKIIGLANLEPEYIVAPVHDPYTLHQMKNASIAGKYLNKRFNDGANYEDVSLDLTFNNLGDGKKYFAGKVQQNADGNIVSFQVLPNIYDHFISGSASDQKNLAIIPIVYDKLLSVDAGDPGPAEVIEGSRLMLGTHRISDRTQQEVNGGDIAFLGCGTEIVTHVSVCFADMSTDNIFGNVADFLYDTVFALDANWSVLDLRPRMRLFQFKYAPFVFSTIFTQQGSDGLGGLNLVSNLDNFTIITEEGLFRLHECALLSMLFVPGVARQMNSL